MTRKWKELEEGFSSVSTRYDEIYYEKGLKQKLMNKRLDEIIGEVDPKKGEKILEIGPGSGAYTLALFEKGVEVTAIDISKDMIEICKKKVEDKGFKAEFHQGNILKIPIQDETMDKAIAIGIMTHLPEKKMFADAVKEMLRTVKGGGAIWFDLPRYHPIKVLYTKAYLKLKPFSEDSKRLQNHLFTNKNIQSLMLRDRNISVKKIGYGIYYLVKIVKMD